MFTEAPLPRDLHQLRALTFFEAALDAVRRRKSSKNPAQVTLDLLHDLDGHLGLAAHRREGDQPEWRAEAHRLIGRIREAIKDLAEDTVLLHYDGTTCQNPTCGWAHRPARIDGSEGA